MIIKDTEAAKKCFIARKSGLLGSVAAFGLLALGVGAAPAQSAAGAPTEAAAVVQPVGFADLVTKVKPAVISVRVKMDQPSAQAMNDTGGEGALPFNGDPLEKFF